MMTRTTVKRGILFDETSFAHLDAGEPVVSCYFLSQKYPDVVVDL